MWDAVMASSETPDSSWEVAAAAECVRAAYNMATSSCSEAEVDPSKRAPTLRRYLEVAPGARAHFSIDEGAPLEQFEQIAGQFPVFRIRISS